MHTRLSLRPLALRRNDYPPGRRWLGSRWYWLCQLVGWGPIGAAFLLANLANARPHAWVVPTFVGGGGLLLTHLLRVILLRLRLRARSWPAFALPLLVSTVLLGAGMTGLSHGAALLFAPELLARNVLPAALAYWVPVFETSCLFAVWIGFYLGIAYFRGYRRAELARQDLEAACRDAELRILKTQVNPHFLFNSLNTLRWLISNDPEQAREAVTLLADLLRSTLTTANVPTIPLRQELETVQMYLALEQLRFEERLQVRWGVADDTLDVPVPPALLQTVVENAVKYGIATRSHGGEIGLTASMAAGQLKIVVTNPGRLGAHAGESTRLGLENARGRLRHLCGGRASLTLEQSTPETVAAMITIPCPVGTAALDPVPAA